jgi:protein SCO1/2
MAGQEAAMREQVDARPGRGRRMSGVAAALGAGLLMAILMVLAACEQKPAFNGADITGADFGRGFELTDPAGKRRALTDFQGKIVAIFFGYVQCPDVCPTTMADMARARTLMGPAASDVQVVFVSVDPERDTREILAAYVPGFDPTFIGLSGTPDEIERVAREYKVFYRKVNGPTPTSYTVDHTAGIYVHDRQGRLRLFIKYGTPPELIAADLKKL